MPGRIDRGIKLDGVRVIEYTSRAQNYFYYENKVYPINLNETIGHDPHNKIIIVKELSENTSELEKE